MGWNRHGMVRGISPPTLAPQARESVWFVFVVLLFVRNSRGGGGNARGGTPPFSGNLKKGGRGEGWAGTLTFINHFPDLAIAPPGLGCAGRRGLFFAPLKGVSFDAASIGTRRRRNATPSFKPSGSAGGFWAAEPDSPDASTSTRSTHTHRHLSLWSKPKG